MLAFLLALNVNRVDQSSITVAPGVYTFAEVAKVLTSPTRRVFCDGDLKSRACVLSLKARTWPDVQDIFSSGLGLTFAPVPNQSVDTYKLSEPKATSLLHDKMRSQLFEFFEAFEKEQSKRVADLGRNVGSNPDSIEKKISDIEEEINAETDAGLLSRLRRDRSDLTAAYSYVDGSNRLGVDQFLSADPDPPSESRAVTNLWSEIPLSALPSDDLRAVQAARAPGQTIYTRCLFHWGFHRSVLLSFKPEWMLVGQRCQNNMQTVSAPQLDVSKRGHILDVLNGGDPQIGWTGFGSLSDVNEQALDSQTEQVLANKRSQGPITAEHLDCFPAVLLAWSKQTDSDIAEELQPFADSIPQGSTGTLALALEHCVQIGLRNVRGCTVGVDKLQFLDEAIRLPIEGLINLRRMLERKNFPKALPEEVFRAYLSADDQAGAWFEIDNAPQRYMGVPEYELAHGSLAFVCWDELGKNMSASNDKFSLTSAPAGITESAAALSRSGVYYYQGFLGNFGEILRGHDLSLFPLPPSDGKGFQIGLTPRDLEGPMLFSAFKLIRSGD